MKYNNLIKILSKFYLLAFFILISILCFIPNGIINSLLKKNNIKNQCSKISKQCLRKFTPYSQDFEDFILFYLFYDIHNGFYIDLGANDPNFISVTKAFYEIGWHGINIEPLPYKYELLKKFRKRDINIEVGTGKKKGNSSLIINYPHGESSSIFFNKNKNNSNIINIKIETMSDICKKFIPFGSEIHFCKIDVEGSEKDTLLGFDFINYRPKVFCIESFVADEPEKQIYKEWEYILTSNDYNFAYAFRKNRFYYDKRINGFKGKFNNIHYYVKIFYKKFEYLKKKYYKYYYMKNFHLKNL